MSLVINNTVAFFRSITVVQTAWISLEGIWRIHLWGTKSALLSPYTQTIRTNEPDWYLTCTGTTRARLVFKPDNICYSLSWFTQHRWMLHWNWISLRPGETICRSFSLGQPHVDRYRHAMFLQPRRGISSEFWKWSPLQKSAHGAFEFHNYREYFQRVSKSLISK